MKYLRISAMAAVLSLALTVPALAVGPFSDVPAGTALYDSVMYLVDRGITAGTGAAHDRQSVGGDAVPGLWRK